MNGTVKWFNVKRGFGYITGEDGNDYFVHYSGINHDGFKRLRNRQHVKFELGENEKGTVAVNVSVLKKA